MKKCPICGRSFEDAVKICEFDGSVLRERQNIHDPYLGRILRDRYRIIERIGHTSMSDVYLAEQVLIDRKVLLKVIAPEYASDGAFVRRFRQEAKLISSLNHPRLIQLFDFDQEADGSFFIVTEHVQGRTLKQVIQTEVLEIGRALRFAIQIAEGLAAAHSAGVIHRDINPQNITVINDRDDIKIADFGFARSREFEATIKLTQVGMILGDPYYIAPEQIEGSDTDERTDIYSLGIILYEMLCGVVPFTASNPTAVWMKHLNEQPISPTNLRQEIPLRVEEIVLRALRKKPDQRWARMSDMAEALSNAEGELTRNPTAQNTVAQSLASSSIASPPVQPVSRQEPLQPRDDYRPERQSSPDDLAPKTVIIQNFDSASLNMKTSESGSTTEDSISKTMMLTQALEVIPRRQLNWKWLGVGGGVILASVLISWTIFFRDTHVGQQKPVATPTAAVAEPRSSRPPQLSSISIDAEKLELRVGEPAALRLTGRYDDGSVKTVEEAGEINWSSSNPTVATADSKGKITAKKVGTTTVRTRYMGLETPPIAIVVTQPATKVLVESKPVFLTIKSSKRELTVKERLRLRVIGKYSDGREHEIKSGLRWESSAPEIASVDVRGMVLGQKDGQAELTARYGDIASEPMGLLIKLSPALSKPAPVAAPRADQPISTAMIEERIKFARKHKDQGEYTEALSELHKASKIDPTNRDVQTAISDTKRACNAEKTLGRADLKC